VTATPYPEGPARSCVASSRRLAEQYPELRYVEGWVVYAYPEWDWRGRQTEVWVAHAWCERPDGTIVDSTRAATLALSPALGMLPYSYVRHGWEPPTGPASDGAPR
jgi:hypothetical protein